MKNPNRQSIITQAAFAKRLKVNPQRITKLIDAGIIDRRPDGRLNFEESLAKAQTYLRAQEESQALHSGKNALITRKLLLQCERLQIENDRERGKSHEKEACCLSLMTLLSGASYQLHGLGRRVMARLPELPRNALDAIDNEVDGTIDFLKSDPFFREADEMMQALMQRAGVKSLEELRKTQTEAV